MKRLALLSLAVVASLALFCAYAVLFVGGPLSSADRTIKLLALGTCAFLAAMTARAASS